jgi:nucleotide-binding universal stress UspA family protein
LGLIAIILILFSLNQLCKRFLGMKNILVPTDFSDLATNAFEIGADLARTTNSSLHILHVASKREKVEESQKKMDELLKSDKLKGIEVKSVFLQEKLEGAIVKTARDIDVDIIVMGARGEKLSSRIVGSNTERVVRLAQRPVLVIKNKIEQFKIENIVFASSFYTEIRPVFPKIQEFAEFNNAKLHLLKVITPKNFETTSYTRKLMTDFADRNDLKNYTINIYNEESKDAGINKFAQEVNADLIAMTTHGRKGLSQVLLGSLTESVASESQIPVLSVKLPEKKSNNRILFPE